MMDSNKKIEIDQYVELFSQFNVYKTRPVGCQIKRILRSCDERVLWAGSKIVLGWLTENALPAEMPANHDAEILP